MTSYNNTTTNTEDSTTRSSASNNHTTIRANIMTVNTMDTPAAAAAPATTAASSAAVASKSGHNNNKEKTSNSSTQTNSQKKEKSGTGCSLDVLEQGLQKQEHKGKHKEKHSHKEKEKDKEKDKELADSVHSASSSVSSSSADSVSSHVARNKNKQRRRLFTALILVMGAGASAAFLSVAIRGVETAQLDLFHRRAADISRAIEVAWADYELFGLWVHDTCHLVVEQQEEEETENSTTILPHTCSYERFQQSYQYISSVGTPFQALQLLVNITNQQRPAYEAQMKDYYDNHQQQYKVNYTGLKAYVGNNNSATTNSATTNTNTNNASTVIPMWEEPFYFALHHTAPIQGNEEAIGLDVYSRPTRKVIDKAILTWKPALSQRIRLVQETQQDAYGIILIHPGHKLQSPPQTTSTSTSSNEQTPHSLSQVVIRIPDLLTVAAKRASVSLAVSVFDSTLTTTDTLDNNDSNSNTQPPLFLGGASIQVQDHDHDHIIIGDSDQDLHNHDHLSSEEVKVTNTPEIQLSEIRKHSTTKATTSTTKRRYRERQIHIADRTWTVAVSALDNTFQPELVFVILGGCIIFMASVLCAFWFHTHMERIDKMNQLKAKAEAEKTTLILETTKQQALAERQLNDFIAHEVRNPLSSAMAALSFISASIDKISHHCNGSGSCSGNSRNSGKYLVQEETRSNNTNTIIQAETKEMREDVEVIDASLQFINELMRNMLDMHRASSKMMKIDMKPIDIRRDVLQAVAAILYVRGKSKVQVLMECHPENLFVVSDRLRLKQIVLNLALNASKFVEEGYIRLRAEVVQQPILQDTGHNQNNSDSNSNNTHNNVRIYVEDSGPGIPAEKWDKLFVKFQDSLDVLNQGTGIGLCLCKHLSDLMGCSIGLDETFHSGIEGCPGTRFVLDLNMPPTNGDEYDNHNDNDVADTYHKNDQLDGVATIEKYDSGSANNNANANANDYSSEKNADHGSNTNAQHQPSSNIESSGAAVLPSNLSVLFVDDDLVLRKMFNRSVKRVAPEWTIEEASNGETALHLVETNHYDIIFMDQYMASAQKQLTGVETVRALRAKGIACQICGLSANDVEFEFMAAGADSFMFKPFPCAKDALTTELLRVLKERKYIRYGDN